jgi:hypothetical protein
MIKADTRGEHASGYRERIAFLDRVFGAPDTASPLLGAIESHLNSQPLATSLKDEGIEALPTETNTAGRLKKQLEKFPFDPGDHLN